MDKKIRSIAETAVMLALLIALQALTKPMGQLVTGSFVNCILAVTVLLIGIRGGIAVALISPVFAFLLNIAPNFVTVLPIMAGNICFVVLLGVLYKSKPLWWQPVALLAAAGIKFGVLYLLVVEVICGVAADALLGKTIGTTVVLAPPMLKMLPAMFTWPQLFTALIGGGVALLITPVLRKALRK